MVDRGRPLQVRPADPIVWRSTYLVGGHTLVPDLINRPQHIVVVARIIEPLIGKARANNWYAIDLHIPTAAQNAAVDIIAIRARNPRPGEFNLPGAFADNMQLAWPC